MRGSLRRGHHPSARARGATRPDLRRWVSALLLGTSAGACTPSDTPPPVTIYVTVGFEDQVHVLDGRTGEPLETLPLNPRLGEVDEPHGVAVHSGTGHWYATVSHGTPTLWKFELQTDRLVGRLTLPLQGASRIGLSPDGSLGLIPDYFRGSLGDPTAVALVSLHDLEVLWTRDLCVAPHDAAFSPDGRSAALACALSDEVVLFTLDEPSRWRSVQLDEGSRPMNLAWAHDGSRLFSTLMGADEVVAIDPAEGRGGRTHRHRRFACTDRPAARGAVAGRSQQNRGVRVSDRRQHRRPHTPDPHLGLSPPRRGLATRRAGRLRDMGGGHARTRRRRGPRPSGQSDLGTRTRRLRPRGRRRRYSPAGSPSGTASAAKSKAAELMQYLRPVG